MAFAPGQKITAADYNDLLTQLNEVYGTGTGDKGYGATELPLVDAFPFDPTADRVKADTVSKDNDFADLTESIELMGQHQGDVPPLPTINQPGDDIELGDPIQAFSEFQPAIDQVTANRFDIGPSSTTITSPTLLSARTDPWSSQIRHTFTVDFGSDDNARWFFNTGGQIRMSMSAPDTLTSHNWGGLYNAAGTFIFDALEYFNLSPTINNPSTVLIASAGASAYSVFGNQWVITAKWISGTSSNGARGSKLEFTSLSDDVYTGVNDIITGLFTSVISERRSITFFNQPAPIYETTSALGSFSPLATPSAYEINKSLLFDKNDSDYLTRTPAGTTNRKTWTYSTWFKRGNIDGFVGNNLLGVDRGGGFGDRLMFGNDDDDNYIHMAFNDAISGSLRTTAIFVDSTAWYHIVCAVDTTQAIASDRVNIYINGIQITDFFTETYPALNFDTMMNHNVVHHIGSRGGSVSQFFDGYMAETIMIDGQALDATNFGEFDGNGDWKSIDPDGLTFGTNGFWLDYEDSTTVAALGADISGQSNHWTPNNITVNNQVLDTPTDSTGLVFSINLNTNGYNLASNLNLTSAANITLNIRPGVVVGSTTTGIPALHTGGLPAGSSLFINNEGRIQGAGGNGGAGGDGGVGTIPNGPEQLNPGQPGSAGGSALSLTLDTVIDNAIGEIWSGGGGGAGGASSDDGNLGQAAGGGGGGGGAGVITVGLGGAGGSAGGGGAPAGFSGSPGSSEVGGAGGSPGLGGPQGNGSPGSFGGDSGSPGGSTGGVGGAAGGGAGNALIKNGNSATFLGGDGAPNIKGPVI